LNSGFERAVANLMQQHEIQRDNEDADEKRVKRLTQSEKLWTSMAKSSGSLAKNVLDIGAGVLKWGAVLAGGLIGGSLFGIDRMAGRAADQRRSSMGLGVTPGEQKSFETNLGRFVNSGSFLSGINAATSNPALSGPLYALGVNPNQSNGDVAIATLRAIRSKALAMPENQRGLVGSMYGLDQFGIGAEDIRRTWSVGDKEFEGQIGQYRRDAKTLNVSDNTGKAWTDFMAQMDRAGQQIYKIFVNGLLPLEKPLEHLSGSLVKFLETLSKSPLLEKGINDLSGWLENFSGQISSPKFLDSVSTFVSDVGALANAIHTATHPAEWGGAQNLFANPLSAQEKDKTSKWLSGIGNWFSPSAAGVVSSMDSYKSYLAKRDMLFGLPPGTSERVFNRESGGNLHPANSSKGAIGPFQLMPGTAAQYGANPYDTVSNTNAGTRYLGDLYHRYNGDLAKALAAYDYGPANLDKVLKEHPDNWLRYTPKETQDYVGATAPITTRAPGVTININNNTGGNAVVSASALAQ
jgi:transglycosylase-like protein with SLT domain